MRVSSLFLTAMAAARPFRCRECGLTVPEGVCLCAHTLAAPRSHRHPAQRDAHLKSSLHLFRAAAKGPAQESDSEEDAHVKKRTPSQERAVRQSAPKRSRIEPVFVPDLSDTDSGGGGDSPVRTLNVVGISSEDEDVRRAWLRSQSLDDDLTEQRDTHR